MSNADHNDEWAAKATLLGVEIEHDYVGTRRTRFSVICRSKKGDYTRVYGSTRRRCMLNLLKEVQAGRVYIVQLDGDKNYILARGTPKNSRRAGDNTSRLARSGLRP